MTREEAIKMIKAKLECMTRDVSGRDSDCIDRRCDECPLNYEQGNMGEQKEWLKMAIEALKTQPSENEQIIKELEQESKADKALNLLAEWVIECGFGYDNIPEEYEKYKDDIAEMGYREGLVHIVKMESEE